MAWRGGLEEKESAAMKFPIPTSSWLVLAMLASTAASLQASVLLYEGFSYGLADNANINGTTATGTGVQGNWTVTKTGTGTTSNVYKTAGLSFGSNFVTSGSGSLRLSATYSGGNTVSSVTVNLSNTATGTVWSSYLLSYSTAGSTSNGGSLITGVATAADGATSSLKSGMLSNTSVTALKAANGYDATSTASANFAFVADTTYLFISRFTNVGATLGGGTDGVGTTWALTLAQYESWLAGGATETGLDSNYSARAIDTASAGAFTYDSNGYLVFRADAPDNNGSSMTMTIDEVRFGTELADIYAVPEPSVFSSLALAAGVIGFSRRRRNA